MTVLTLKESYLISGSHMNDDDDVDDDDDDDDDHDNISENINASTSTVQMFTERWFKCDWPKTNVIIGQ